MEAFGAFWKPFGEVLGGSWLNFATFVLLCAASCCIFAALVVFSVPVAVVVAVSVVVIVAVIMAVVVACWAWFFCVLLLRGASEASEQSERAKLSGACSGFPLLTHAFAGVPLLSLAFCCFASLHVVWHFLLNGTLAFPHSCSILFLVAPCLVLFSLVLPCANIS